MRVPESKQHQSGSLGPLRHGQVVRGRISEAGGKTFLHHNGTAVRVHFQGAVPRGKGLFRVEIRSGEIFLSEVVKDGESGTDVRPPPALPGTNNQFLSRLSVFRGRTPIPAGTSGLFEIFSILHGGEAEKAVRLLRLYLEKKLQAKKSGHCDDSIIRGELSFKEGGLKDLLDLLSGFNGEKADGHHDNRQEQEFCFSLLPVTGDGDEDMVPLLMLGEAGERNRAWLFSECDLSRLGAVRIVLILDRERVYGSVFCQSSVVPELKDALQGMPYRIAEDGTLSESFALWPLEAFSALSREESHGVV